MPTAFTVIVPEALQVLGRWHFSVKNLFAACGEQLHLTPGPTTVTVTLHQQDQHACFACTVIAELKVIIPMHGSLTVIFPTVRASGVVSSVANLLINIIAVVP